MAGTRDSAAVAGDRPPAPIGTAVLALLQAVQRAELAPGDALERLGFGADTIAARIARSAGGAR